MRQKRKYPILSSLIGVKLLVDRPKEHLPDVAITNRLRVDNVPVMVSMFDTVMDEGLPAYKLRSGDRPS